MRTLRTDRPSASGGASTQVRRVIVGVDDTRPGLAALAAATRLARSYGAGLVAVRAWALGLPRHGGRRMRHLAHPHIVLSFSGGQQREAAEVLVRKAFGIALGGLPADVPVTIQTPDGDPAVALLSVASRPGDVIVLGMREGNPGRRLLHGSVGRYCLRHASCPVFRVPAEPEQAGHGSRGKSRRQPGHGDSVSGKAG